METTKTIEQALTEMGGNLWERGDMRRIYFDNVASLYGLKMSRYGSGAISAATLDGDKISNAEARRLMGRMMSAKLWYDLADGQWHGRGFSNEWDDYEVCVAEAQRRLDAIMA